MQEPLSHCKGGRRTSEQLPKSCVTLERLLILSGFQFSRLITISLPRFLCNSIKVPQGYWGNWVAQLAECLTLDLGSLFDLRIVGLSPALGTMLGMETSLKTTL